MPHSRNPNLERVHRTIVGVSVPFDEAIVLTLPAREISYRSTTVWRVLVGFQLHEHRTSDRHYGELPQSDDELAARVDVQREFTDLPADKELSALVATAIAELHACTIPNAV